MIKGCFLVRLCTIVNYVLGIDCTVHPLDVLGVSNVTSTLKSAFQSLFDRLTSDMTPHDFRLIRNSHQLDKPISLPFPQRDQLTPDSFLVVVEQVVQSNDVSILDNSVNVNVIHVEIPYGGTGRKLNVVDLESYFKRKDCIIQKQR